MTVEVAVCLSVSLKWSGLNSDSNSLAVGLSGYIMSHLCDWPSRQLTLDNVAGDTFSCQPNKKKSLSTLLLLFFIIFISVEWLWAGFFQATR